MNEGKAAVLGGVVSGALSGLAADLASGGLTFGAGLVTGGLLGALGAAGLARAFNLVRGRSTAYVRWGGEFLDGLVAAALIRYLAVAHYGRGRGEWTESEAPPFWKEWSQKHLAPRAAAFASLWAGATNAANLGSSTPRCANSCARRRSTARAAVSRRAPSRSSEQGLSADGGCGIHRRRKALFLVSSRIQLRCVATPRGPSFNLPMGGPGDR